MKSTFKVYAGETINFGDAVMIRKRTWKERLFSLPWRPFLKREATKVKNLTMTVKK